MWRPWLELHLLVTPHLDVFFITIVLYFIEKIVYEHRAQISRLRDNTVYCIVYCTLHYTETVWCNKYNLNVRPDTPATADCRGESHIHNPQSTGMRDFLLTTRSAIYSLWHYVNSLFAKRCVTKLNVYCTNAICIAVVAHAWSPQRDDGYRLTPVGFFVRVYSQSPIVLQSCWQWHSLDACTDGITGF